MAPRGGRAADGLSAIHKARDLGESLHLPDIESYAAHAIGMTQARGAQDGIPSVERALQIALDAGLPETAGNTYSSLQEAAVLSHRFADAERYFTAGMSYCEGRELGVFSLCLLGWRTRALLLLGRWDDAASICAQMLNRRGISPVNKLNPLCVLGGIRGRRGEPGAWELLDEALALAEGTGEPEWIVPVRVELRWLAGELELAADEARADYGRALGWVNPWASGSLAIWLARLEVPADLPAELPEPFAREMAGDWPGAPAAWARLGRPYDAALARLSSCDEAGLRQALATFNELGARTTVAPARRRMKDLGISAIPRSPRPATRAAPAGLTAREAARMGIRAPA